MFMGAKSNKAWDTSRQAIEARKAQREKEFREFRMALTRKHQQQNIIPATPAPGFWVKIKRAILKLFKGN